MFCKMWLTADVLCCTASILNLCAIALDRFYALHDPIEHARRRTVNQLSNFSLNQYLNIILNFQVNFVLGMITLVWLVSCLICLPPVIGWNDWPEVCLPYRVCLLWIFSWFCASALRALPVGSLQCFKLIFCQIATKICLKIRTTRKKAPKKSGKRK